MNDDDDKVISFAEKADHWRRLDLLSRRPRVRRTDKLPEWAAEETAKVRRYPGRLTVSAQGHAAVFRQSRWEPIDDDKALRVRTTFMWLLHGGERIGALQFKEYDFEDPNNGYIFEWLDGESNELAAVATTLCAAWESVCIDVSGYGPLVELEFVWMRPRYPARHVWLEPAEQLIAKLTEKGSLFFLHYFPVEYAGLVGKKEAAVTGFERRRKAMLRFCARRWGMQLFPGPPGNEGWMWRIPDRVIEFIDPPQHNPDWLSG